MKKALSFLNPIFQIMKLPGRIQKFIFNHEYHYYFKLYFVMPITDEILSQWFISHKLPTFTQTFDFHEICQSCTTTSFSSQFGSQQMMQFLWKTNTFMIGKSFAICTLHFKHDSESTQESKFSHHVCTGNTRMQCSEKPMLSPGSGNLKTSEKNFSLFNHEGKKRKYLS